VQKALPLVYDDSLSYYELLCKVVDYINNLTSDVNNMVNVVNEAEEFIDGAETKLQKVLDKGTSDFETAITNGNTAINTAITNANTNIANAIQDLTEYRNNYFENLGVQEEVNNKLDAMASNGELTQIINTIISPAMAHPWVVQNVSEMTGDTYLYVLASTGELYQPQGSQGYVPTGFIYGGVNSFRVLPAVISDTTANVNLNEYNTYSCIKLIDISPNAPDASFPGLNTNAPFVVFKCICDNTHVVQELIMDNSIHIRYGTYGSTVFSEWDAIV
jgi:hypothetical protein